MNKRIYDTQLSEATASIAASARSLAKTLGLKKESEAMEAAGHKDPALHLLYSQQATATLMGRAAAEVKARDAAHAKELEALRESLKKGDEA